MKKKINRHLLLFFLGAAAAGCSGDFLNKEDLLSNPTLNNLAEQAAKEASIQSTKVRFHYSDFYTNTNTNSFACAGDIRNFYSTTEGDFRSPTKLSEDTLFGQNTLKPAFIKAISVDLTDSNAVFDSNQALSCSYGTEILPATNCASFDYGVLGGISSDLSGSLLMIGGLTGKNFANQLNSTTATGQTSTLACGALIPLSSVTGDDGEDDVNVCQSEVFALGVDRVPATEAGSALAPGLSSSSEPISTWLKVSAKDGNTPPDGGTGGAASYQLERGELLLFGGQAPMDTTTTPYAYYDTRDTWVFSTQKKEWVLYTAPSAMTADISHMADCSTGTCTGSIASTSKGVGGRALHGYIALPQTALSGLTDDGLVSAGTIDKTDRILVLGGLAATSESGTETHATTVHRINPTYGPEYVNLLSNATTNAMTSQWIDSHYMTLVNNLLNPFVYNSTTVKWVNFGAVPMRNITGVGATNVGDVFLMGGFRSDEATVSGAIAVGASFDDFHWLGRTTPASESDADEFQAWPTFSIADYYSASLTQGANISAGKLYRIDNDAPSNFSPVGGLSAQAGFDPTDNEVVYWGGSNCKGYLTAVNSSNICPGSGTPGVAATFSSASRYYDVGDSLAGVANGTAFVSSTATAGSPPARAGMASARGLDGDSPKNVLIVAWGGVSSMGNATDSSIYYLYNNAGTPTWASYLPAEPRPKAAANASMVYSHITHKFYLFGGYETSPTPKNSNQTWELTVNNDCSAGGCTFTWKKLTGDGGTTCYPECTDGPPARRSHRMVEVNYNREKDFNNADAEYTTCTEDSGCSFGIFMEGGTQDGYSALSDRWMFDPTANGGRGHWQRMDDPPPRHLAAAASFSYFVPSLNKRVYRSLLFGGETGLHSPKQASSNTTQVFIAPTLGDTQMFDHEENQWHRVRLLGKGTDTLLDATDGRSQKEFRQSFLTDPPGISGDATTAEQLNLNVLTPPPTSGGFLAVRTNEKSSVSGSNVKELKIPEVFLFGGRTKDGLYVSFDKVYKFCPSSTGEDPENNNAHCDAFDASSNPDSTSPSSEFEGRWLYKTPNPFANFSSTFNTVAADRPTPSSTYSYMGAGAYDSRNDRILVFGGLAPGAAGNRITSTTDRVISGVSGGKTKVFEYTPPSESLIPYHLDSDGQPVSTSIAAAPNDNLATVYGYWTQAEPCDSSVQPTGRYGHSMSYDPLNGQVIVVGGYDISDELLTQTWSSITIPEIWAGKRNLTSTVTGADATTTYCYAWRQITTFGNNLDSSDAPAPEDGLAHPASVFLPSKGYHTGYYTTMDESCTDLGPIATTDPVISKAYAGGIYIDLDRSKLGPNENLLLTLTYIPLGDLNQKPYGASFDNSEEAQIRVHLVKTGLSKDSLQSIIQPRYFTYTNPDSYPEIVQTLSLTSLPTGSLRQDQLILPVSIDPAIDRIRIERYLGSAIFIDVNIHRMGYQ